MGLALDRGLVTKTPCHRIELPRVTREEQRYLSEAQVEALVEEVDGRYKPLFYVAAYLGLRWQELAGLRPSNLELESPGPASLRVVSTIKRSDGRYWVAEYGKSDAARRTLKMPDFLRDALRWHLRAQPGSDWVFAAPEGGYLRYDNFMARYWRPSVRRAGLAPLTFHQLRHTAAAFMIDEGAGQEQVKRRMGHEDIRTTYNVYGHLFPDREDELVEALDRRQREARARHADSRLTASDADVVDLDEKRQSDQPKELVDQRGVEPLTSPVRGVRSTN
jgi:integrase